MNNKIKHIYLMADAADGGNSGDEVDPMTQAAGGIDTSFPVLKGDRILQMEIVSMKKKEVKEKPGRFNLEILMRTTKDATLSDDRIAKAGFKGYKRLSITPSEAEGDKQGRTRKDIARDLAQLCQAAGRPDIQPLQITGALDQAEPGPMIDGLNGILVDVRVGVNPAKGNFPESNSFGFVIPAK